MSTCPEQATEHFRSGCNCAQAVLLPFADRFGLDPRTAMRLTAGLGGGLGRLREVCGAVSGMALVLGLEQGNEDPRDAAARAKTNANVQRLARLFRERHGSIVCRELLALEPGGGPPSSDPESGTGSAYRRRPCVEYVADATALVEAIMRESAPARNGADAPSSAPLG